MQMCSKIPKHFHPRGFMIILSHYNLALLQSILGHIDILPSTKNEIERQVRELLQAGLITHSTNPFASPVLLVQKKNMVAGDFALIIGN